MHPVARRCVSWAAVLVAVGTLTLVYGTDLLAWFQELVGFNGEPALHAFSVITGVVRSFALPLAAGLVSAAIVIQTLAPSRQRASADAER